MKYHVIPHETGHVVAHLSALGGGVWIADGEPMGLEQAKANAEGMNRAWLIQRQLEEARRLEQQMRPRRAVRWFPDDEFA